jgi:MtN3 and saliva related transmembrane protein
LSIDKLTANSNLIKAWYASQTQTALQPGQIILAAPQRVLSWLEQFRAIARCRISGGEIQVDIASFFGVIASIFTSIRFIPQVYRSFSTRKTTDLSLTFLYFVSAQSVFLILYGITRPDQFVLYMNILPLASALFLLVLKLKYR